MASVKKLSVKADDEDPGIDKLAKIFADLLKKNLEREFGTADMTLKEPQIEIKKYHGEETAKITIPADLKSQFLGKMLKDAQFDIFIGYKNMMDYIEKPVHDIRLNWSFNMEDGGRNGWSTPMFKFKH